MKKQPHSPIEDPDLVELMEALGEIDIVMKGRPKEFATSLGVALRDWICDRYGDDEVGYAIMREIGGAPNAAKRKY